jgi:hypothetical protein
MVPHANREEISRTEKAAVYITSKVARACGAGAARARKDDTKATSVDVLADA